MQYVPGLHRSGVGEGRRDLPDLPRPVPQRLARRTIRRPATCATTIRSRRCRWGVKPEGFCRNYADGDANCPWRFDTTPPADSPTKESPRGRDYFGGDLQGRRPAAPVPRRSSVSPRSTSTRSSTAARTTATTPRTTRRSTRTSGPQKDFDRLIKDAKAHGIRVILDGVFNHMSSDSPSFDRYHHYSSTGACESATSAYRSWFTFHDVTAGHRHLRVLDRAEPTRRPTTAGSGSTRSRC